MKNILREQPSDDEIARAAYQLWEQHGRPQGCDVQFWLEAEQQILSSAKPILEPCIAFARSPNALAVRVQTSRVVAKPGPGGPLLTKEKRKVRSTPPQPAVSSAHQTKPAARVAAHP